MSSPQSSTETTVNGIQRHPDEHDFPAAKILVIDSLNFWA